MTPTNVACKQLLVPLNNSNNNKTPVTSVGHTDLLSLRVALENEGAVGHRRPLLAAGAPVLLVLHDQAHQAAVLLVGRKLPDLAQLELWTVTDTHGRGGAGREV